jgi:hypothetical protein
LAARGEQLLEGSEVSVDGAHPNSGSAGNLVPTGGLDSEFAVGLDSRVTDPLARLVDRIRYGITIRDGLRPGVHWQASQGPGVNDMGHCTRRVMCRSALIGFTA